MEQEGISSWSKWIARLDQEPTRSRLDRFWLLPGNVAEKVAGATSQDRFTSKTIDSVQNDPGLARGVA